MPRLKGVSTLVLQYVGFLFLVFPLNAVNAQQAAVAPSAGDIYKKASPAVVVIELYNDKGEVSSSGSGFLISADGKILTNYHVVAHSKQATVRLANKDAYDNVDVLDFDKRKDIALIKIKAVDLPFLSLGKSGNVDVGDKVFSLSTPLGLLQNTLSEGIVSGIRLGDGYRYFQVSAPISHGSSGGPIFNAAGEVIGIASATIEEGQNLNFAVPIDYAKGLLTSNQPRSLASIYEPEPPAPVPASEKTTPAPTSAPSSPLPEDMKKSSALYLSGKLGVWTVGDAKKELGESISYREGTPAYPSSIFAFDDPTKQFRMFELSFSKSSLKLENIYMYPWNMSWDQCKQLWGSNIRITKNPDGTKFYSYKDRKINVLVTRQGQVQSIGLY